MSWLAHTLRSGGFRVCGLFFRVLCVFQGLPAFGVQGFVGLREGFRV